VKSRHARVTVWLIAALVVAPFCVILVIRELVAPPERRAFEKYIRSPMPPSVHNLRFQGTPQFGLGAKIRRKASLTLWFTVRSDDFECLMREREFVLVNPGGGRGMLLPDPGLWEDPGTYERHSTNALFIFGPKRVKDEYLSRLGWGDEWQYQLLER
jgi:hypothetical protein